MDPREAARLHVCANDLIAVSGNERAEPTASREPLPADTLWVSATKKIATRMPGLSPGTWPTLRIRARPGGAMFGHDLAKRKSRHDRGDAAQQTVQSTIDAMPASVAIVDAGGMIIAANKAWRRSIHEGGFPVRDDGIGTAYLAVRDACKPNAGEARAIAAALDKAIRGERPNARSEYEWPYPGGARRVQLCISRIEQDGEPRLMLTHEDVTDLRRASVALEKVTGTILKSQEDERRRIARELHDSTTQHLVAAKLIVEQLRQHIKGEVGFLASDVEALLQKSLLEIRNLSYLLHPPLLEQVGLLTALRSYVTGFSQRCGIAVELNLPSRLRRLAPAVETALFRVLQEALANIYRHSGSKTARVRLQVGHAWAVLQVADKGKGIPKAVRLGSPDPMSSIGVGIPGMQGRLRQLGGVLRIRSGPRGTILCARVPLSETAAAG